MDLPDRHALVGMAIGAVAATLVAAIGPGAVFEALADEFKPSGIEPSNLVYYEDREYAISNEDWVSTEALSTVQVKKVEAGKVSYVTITTTPSGTYSTDALFSNHVQYPGVTVEQTWPNPSNYFSYWSGGRWFGFSSRHGNSFTYYRSGDVRVRSWGDTTCVSGKGYTVC